MYQVFDAFLTINVGQIDKTKIYGLLRRVVWDVGKTREHRCTITCLFKFYLIPNYYYTKTTSHEQDLFYSLYNCVFEF